MTGTVERFRRSCPLGVCDGSGWIAARRRLARPCECRERRVQQARTQGVRSVLPTKYQGVSFDRPPVSDMARDPKTRARGLGAITGYIDELDANLARRSRALARGRRRDRQDDPGDAGLQDARSRRGHSVAIYSLPRLLARIRRTYDGDGRRALLPRVLPSASPRSTCCTSTTSAPRSAATGSSSSSTRSSTSATRRTARSSSPRTSTSTTSRSRSASGPSRGWPRCARGSRCHGDDRRYAA